MYNSSGCNATRIYTVNLKEKLIFTARRNARNSYGNSFRPSVHLSLCLSVRLSVTRWYYVKTTARSTVQFALSDSTMCLVL